MVALFRKEEILSWAYNTSLADGAERCGSDPWLCHRFAAWPLACHLMSLCPCTCSWGRAWLARLKSSDLLSQRSKLSDSLFVEYFYTRRIFAAIRITFSEAWPCLYARQPPCHCCCCMRMRVGEMLSVGMFWHWVAGTLRTCQRATLRWGWAVASRGDCGLDRVASLFLSKGGGVFRMVIGKSVPSSPFLCRRTRFFNLQVEWGEGGVGWFLCGFAVCFFFKTPDTWALRCCGLLENSSEKIVTKPGFVQIKRSLMLYKRILNKQKKPEKGEGKREMEGADVRGSLAQRSVWYVPLKGRSAWTSIWAVPSCEAPQNKVPEPCRSLRTPEENLSCIPKQYVWQTSNALEGARQSKCLFVLEFSSGISTFPTGEAWFVGTNAAFIRPTCVFGKKNRGTFECTVPSWSLEWQWQPEDRLGKILFSFAVITQVNVAVKARIC